MSMGPSIVAIDRMAAQTWKQKFRGRKCELLGAKLVAKSGLLSGTVYPTRSMSSVLSRSVVDHARFLGTDLAIPQFGW